MHTDAYDRAYELEVFMRTTLNIEEKLISKAREMTGIHEKTHLVRLGLEALIARESSKRLASLGGTERKLKPVPRRRGPVVKNGSR
jgi:Arc/MetJ family transcription regulator